MKSLKATIRGALGSSLYNGVRAFRHPLWTLHRRRVAREYGCRLPIIQLGIRAVVPNLRPQGIAYFFGIGEDLGFELSLIERFELRGYGFDPTPESLNWVKKQDLPPTLSIRDYGVANYDGLALFAPPLVQGWVSYSMARKQPGGIQVPVKRLGTIMRELGHTQVDFLKMDIEGAEYQVFSDMIAQGIFPAQIMVEFHHYFGEIPHRDTRQSVRRLTEAGYRIAWISPDSYEYTFVR
jgi:FkbM family methyltransferase